MLTFDVLCPAWAERADRRPNRCAVACTGRTVPAATHTWRRPAPFSNPCAASGSLLPDSFPNRISRWLHHIHPIHRHHTVPTHLRNRPIMSRPVEDCEGCPALAGVRNLSLDDPSAGCSDHIAISATAAGSRRAAATRRAGSLKRGWTGPLFVGPNGRRLRTAWHVVAIVRLRRRVHDRASPSFRCGDSQNDALKEGNRSALARGLW